MNVGKLLAALTIAVTLAAAFFTGIFISKLLNLLPSPWNAISSILFGIFGLTIIIYVWLGKDKKKESAITKYYFISYIHCDEGAAAFGHCVMAVNNLYLNGIAQEIQRSQDFKTLPTILCLKDLVKKEYEMLKGGSEHGED